METNTINNVQIDIKTQMKAAMIAKEADRLQVLRMISAAFTNELVSQSRPPTDPLSDSDAMEVIKKLAKQRKDSIKQFMAGGREDLADSEKVELAIIEAMLPAKMSREDIKLKIESILADPASVSSVAPALASMIVNGKIDPNKKGPFMGMCMKVLGDTADGEMVKEVIAEIQG